VSSVAEETVDGLSFLRTPPAQGLGVNWRVMGEWQLMRALEARIEEVANQIKPDIIHAHSPVLNAMPALSVGCKLEIPVVYEIRAFWEDAAVDHGTTREGSLRYRLTRALETSAIRRANHVFTIYEGLRADIVARGISASHVTVIPNAVDVETFQMAQPADPAVQEKWGLKGRTVIGFIGSFYAYEGLDLLVAALPDVIKAHPNACLLLVGGAGWLAYRLRRRASEVAAAGHLSEAERQRARELLAGAAQPSSESPESRS